MACARPACDGRQHLGNPKLKPAKVANPSFDPGSCKIAQFDESGDVARAMGNPGQAGLELRPVIERSPGETGS